MRACKSQAWRSPAEQDPYLWPYGIQWIHRLLCDHTWHTDHTGVALCVCCLKTGPHNMELS